MVEVEDGREAPCKCQFLDEDDSQFECFHGTDPFDEKGRWFMSTEQEERIFVG